MAIEQPSEDPISKAKPKGAPTAHGLTAFKAAMAYGAAVVAAEERVDRESAAKSRRLSPQAKPAPWLPGR